MHLSLSGLLKNIQPNRGWDTFGDTSNSPPLTLCPHTELEGYCSVPTGKSLVVTAHETNNVWIGELQKIKLRATNPGVEAPYFKD